VLTAGKRVWEEVWVKDRVSNVAKCIPAAQTIKVLSRELKMVMTVPE